MAYGEPSDFGKLIGFQHEHLRVQKYVLHCIIIAITCKHIIIYGSVNTKATHVVHE